jgi:Flp pilus assembly CpaE family ATPase
VSQAINLARPLVEDSPSSRAAKDMMALARRLAGTGAEQNQDPVEIQVNEARPRKPSFWPFRKGKAAA